tara:strand:- start:186 stop:335 length:150 start_codon:yes stop_codon:yes gene_type:complete
MVGYRTKSEKKRALMAIQAKAMKLYSTGCMTMKDTEAIKRITMATMKRL